MKLTFHIDLPEQDLRIGRFVDPDGRVHGASRRGYQGRMGKRLFPLLICLEALVQVDEWQLARDRYAPLYDSGVYYRTDPPGREDWVDVDHLYVRGWGDCKSLAAVKCAEYRQAGVAAVPCISWKNFDTGGGKRLTLVHVQVLLPNGFIEDPSKVLGMKGDYNDEV